MMAFVDKEEQQDLSRFTTTLKHPWSIAVGIRRQETEAVNTFRTQRLTELHAALEIRLVRAAVAACLQEVIAHLYTAFPDLTPPFDNSVQFPLKETYYV
jgi:hypothetical protein